MTGVQNAVAASLYGAFFGACQCGVIYAGRKAELLKEEQLPYRSAAAAGASAGISFVLIAVCLSPKTPFALPLLVLSTIACSTGLNHWVFSKDLPLYKGALVSIIATVAEAVLFFSPAGPYLLAAPVMVPVISFLK